jgi:hypothetical protein
MSSTPTYDHACSVSETTARERVISEKIDSALAYAASGDYDSALAALDAADAEIKVGDSFTPLDTPAR